MSNTNFTYETVNDNDEPISWEVSCNVSYEQDPYGTGDSPGEWSVEDIKVVTESGVLYEGDISDYHIEQIIQKAIIENH